jgi:hypothetical protein
MDLMSVKEIEDRVRELPPEELLRFARWFDDYCAARAAAVESEISQAQKDELLQRRAEYLANPSVAETWDEGSFDQFVQTLSDARAQRASGGKV